MPKLDSGTELVFVFKTRFHIAQAGQNFYIAEDNPEHHSHPPAALLPRAGMASTHQHTNQIAGSGGACYVVSALGNEGR